MYYSQWEGKTYKLRRTTNNRGIDNKALKAMKSMRNEITKQLTKQCKGDLEKLTESVTEEAKKKTEFAEDMKEFANVCLHTIVPKGIHHLINKPQGEQPKEYVTMAMETIKSK